MNTNHLPTTRADDYEKSNHRAHSTKAGWRVPEWAADVGLSRAFVYELIGDGTIKSVKAGNARIITTRPVDYLASLASPQA